MSEISPGWYADPADPSTQRYWDGEGWLGAAIPADATPPDGPPVESPAVGSPAAPGFAPEAVDPSIPLGGAPGDRSGVPGTVSPPPGWSPTPDAPAYGSPPPPPGLRPGLPVTYSYRREVRPHGLALAGLGQRLAARVIDIIAVLLLNVVVNGWFVYQWLVEFAPIMDQVRARMADPEAPRPVPTERMQSLMLAILFIATALWLAYEVPAIGGTGQTLGKRLLGIKVVPVESLDPIGYGRAMRRWARLGVWTTLWWCYGIGLVFQFIDSVSVLFDKTLRQALHDKTAHTVVVVAPPPAKAATAPPGGGEHRGSTTGDGVADDGPDPTGGAR
ncbi:MAG TPA: RDD family protein [Actinoplanes sp.]|nr:RDD family protein [Actinoplanes sp.]